MKVVLRRREGGGRKEVPFHDFRKVPYHARSARNPALRLIIWLMGWYCVEEVYHPSKEGSSRPDDFARVIEKAYEGFQLLAGACLFISPLLQEGL